MTASPEKLRRLRELQAEKARLETLAASRLDVFTAIGYQPNCLPREEVARALCADCDDEGRLGSARCDHRDVDRDLLPEPCGQCPQERFHAAEEFDVLYGGAAGGGKTYALIAEGIRACMRYPGLRVGAFRKSYPEIEDSILPVLGEFGYAAALGARYDQSKHNLRFPNGSIMMLRHAENMQDATRRLGAEYQLLLFDEMTRTDPAVVKFLSSRLRSGSASIPVLGVRSASNPGGIGHGHVKAHYVEPTEYGAVVTEDDRGRSVRFIPAKVTDNPRINPDYVTDLNVLDENTRKAYRDGSWDSFEGAVFVEWDRDRHLVPRAAVELPSSWIRYGGLDYGWTAPSAYLLGARDEDGRLWLYGELTMTQTPEIEQARRVLALEGHDRAQLRSADPAMWGKTSSALPVAVTFAQEGAPLRRADNDRLTGKARVHSYLADGPPCRYHRDLGWATCPRLHILDGTCPELARTLPNLVYDLRRTEDVDTNGEDHHYDGLRYLLMGIGSTPRLVSFDETDEELRDPLIPEEERLEQHGPVAAPGGAFAIGGSNAANELDPAVMGGQVNPFR